MPFASSRIAEIASALAGLKRVRIHDLAPADAIVQQLFLAKIRWRRVTRAGGRGLAVCVAGALSQHLDCSSAAVGGATLLPGGWSRTTAVGERAPAVDCPAGMKCDYGGGTQRNRGSRGNDRVCGESVVRDWDVERAMGRTSGEAHSIGLIGRESCPRLNLHLTFVCDISSQAFKFFNRYLSAVQSSLTFHRRRHLLVLQRERIFLPPDEKRIGRVCFCLYERRQKTEPVYIPSLGKLALAVHRHFSNWRRALRADGGHAGLFAQSDRGGLRAGAARSVQPSIACGPIGNGLPLLSYDS